MRELLPVLVADLAEDSARDFLREIADAGGETWVPLVAAPTHRAPHLLEVYTPGFPDPLRFLVEPLGPPGEHGFPVRLFPHEEESEQSRPLPSAAPPAPALDDDDGLEFDEVTSPRMRAVTDDRPPDDKTIPQMTSPVPTPSSFPSKPPAAAADSDAPPPQIPFPKLEIPKPAKPPKPQMDRPRIDTPTAMKLAKPAGAARKPAPVSISKEHSAELSGQKVPPSSAMTGDALAGRSLAGGKLEVESLVGAGSLGSVYRARHRDLKIPVAVKVLHESFQHDVEFCQRFYAEALAASRLDHANLVRVYDYGQEADGLLYLSMEFLDGITLRSLLQRGATLSVPRIVEVMTQICAGLAHASTRGIVHRDLRPDNVMLVPGHDDEGRLTEVVKVLDFGIAPVRPAPEYMSPEQCRNETLDERSNVYVCGLLLYELATGKVPFTADKPITVVNRQLSMTPSPIEDARPDLDPRFDEVVQRALKKGKGDRWESIKELRAELKKLLVPADSPTRPTPPPVSHQPASEPMISIPPPARAPVVLEAMPEPMPVAYEAPQARDIAAPKSDPKPEPKAEPKNKLPDWLEDRSEHYSAFLNGASAGTGGEDLVDILQRDAKSWLSKFVQERDPRLFATQVTALDRAVRVLAHQADAKALWAVSSAVNGLVTQSSNAGPNTRAARAAKLIQLFTDPGMLGPIAERVLAVDDDARDAGRTLLIRARTAGAYAIYGARVKHAANPEVRAPFVTSMQEIGTHAWPVIRAALEKIPPAALTGGHPLASDLAEDLLLSVPKVRDEAAGHLVATFVRATVPSLCSAATRALARLWADRARPLLLGLLGNPDEAVRLAAVAGLREMGAVDEHVARRLAPIVAPGAQISLELRTQALAALGSMTEDAKPVAVPILVKVVRDPEGRDDATILNAARALIAVMGREAISVVHERAERSSEPLRTELRRLVRSGTASI